MSTADRIEAAVDAYLAASLTGHRRPRDDIRALVEELAAGHPVISEADRAAVDVLRGGR